MFTQRYYQAEARQAVLAAFAKGVDVAILVMATGTGKTVVFSHLADQFLKDTRVMVLAHRKELIWQARKKLFEVTGHLPGVEMAEHRAARGGYSLESPERIVVGTFDTQAYGGFSRMKQLPTDEFGLLICDEHHHSRGMQQSKLIAHYRLMGAKVVGVTATPDRNDGQKLQGELVYEYSIRTAIDDGYLVPLKARVCPIAGLSFAKVHAKKDSTVGLNEKEMEAEWMFEKPLHGAVSATIEAAYDLEPQSLCDVMDEAGELLPDWRERFEGMIAGKTPRVTVFFAQGVKHSERSAEIFNRWLPGSARHVDGKTPDEEREQIFKDNAAGKFTFLCNYGICVEGVDVPNVSMIAMARKTTSRSLYSQCVGRGTRPAGNIAHKLTPEKDDALNRVAMIAASEKPNLLIVDFTGKNGRHRLVTAADLFCESAAAATVPTEGDIDLMAESDKANDALELARAANKVVSANKGRWDADDAVEAPKKPYNEALELEFARKRAGIIATARYRTREYDPFGPFQLEAEGDPELIMPKCSPKLMQMLKKMGVAEDVAAGYGNPQAWQVLNSMRKKRCSLPQAKYLRVLGVPENEIASMNYKMATDRIKILKGGGHAPARMMDHAHKQKPRDYEPTPV